MDLKELNLQTDILIQNVSAQCIPNLVAAKTFKPKKIIWVYSAEFGDVLNRLRTQTMPITSNQENWLVDVRDAEALHQVLQSKFETLGAQGKVIYHLTGGTKSMSLQGLYNLGTFRRHKHAEVMGTVMDPRSQHFDVIYPHPKNNVFPCARLTLDEMLAVHGNQWDTNHTHTEPAHCAAEYGLWEAMRSLSKTMKREFSMNELRALHKRPVKGRLRHFKSKKPIPASFRKILQMFQTNGLIENLKWAGASEFRYEQLGEDIIKLINGGWLEYWLGAVLHNSDIDWRGARVSAKYLEGKGGSQELDFLGATASNRLVYWSCKTDSKLTNDKLFEVDALRDGVAGADFHVAGILHSAAMSDVMQAKARRIGLKAVHVYAPDAVEQLLACSRG